MKQTILVVEDEEDILDLLTEEFDAVGDYQVLRARDGEEALRITLTHNPDIIILDIQLPKLNGYEVCRSIKSDQAVANTKILMISGMAQSSDRQKALQAGADDYLTKPFNLTILAEKVEILLGKT